MISATLAQGGSELSGDNWKKRERNGREGGSPVLVRNQNDTLM
jgi:hypothetical protein